MVKAYQRDRKMCKEGSTGTRNRWVSNDHEQVEIISSLSNPTPGNLASFSGEHGAGWHLQSLQELYEFNFFCK